MVARESRLAPSSHKAARARRPFRNPSWPRCPLKKMLSWSSGSRKKSEKRRMNISARCRLFIEAGGPLTESLKAVRTAEARPAIDVCPPAEPIPIGKRVF